MRILFLFRSLARNGIGLVKYLKVGHWDSMKKLGVPHIGPVVRVRGEHGLVSV